MDKVISDILFICIGLFFLFFGLWGTINFSGFSRWYVKFCDSRNTMKINYPKGDYLKFTLIGFVLMSLIMGTLLAGTAILSILNIIEG